MVRSSIARETGFVEVGPLTRALEVEDVGILLRAVLQIEIRRLGPGDDEYRAQYLLSSLGLTGAEDPTKISGGEGRRARGVRAEEIAADDVAIGGGCPTDGIQRRRGRNVDTV